MTVEDDLQELADRAATHWREISEATDEATKEHFLNLRRVIMMEASGHVARSPTALRAKASILQHEDLDRPLTPGAAYLMESLLRELLQWNTPL